MIQGLANQARSAQEDIKRDLQAATAKLAPLTPESLASHQARRDARLYLAAKAAYTDHQAWLDDEYFSFDGLPARDREHWIELVVRAANIIWGKR